MLYHTWKLFQMTVKNLLRSKAFLFFVIVLPILATLILNVKDTGDVIAKEGQITELNKLDAQVAYLNDYSMISVKVYDQCKNELSDALLKEMQQAGMYQIYRVDARKSTSEEILESAKHTAKKDKVGVVLVLSSSLEKELLDGNVTSSVKLYKTGEDERYTACVSTVKTLLQKYALLGKESGTSGKLVQNIQSQTTKEVQLKSVEKNGSSSVFGMDVNYKKTGVFGGALAILTVAFMFSGILILGTIMKERENLVFTRIMLSKASNISYLLSKFIVVFFTSILQTLVSTGAYWVLVRGDVGLSVIQFAFIIFLLGMLFNLMSVCIGIFAGSVMTAMYLSFIVWMITALLGGMYFDISSASEMFQRVAMLMPQRWGLKAASMFMKGDLSAYPLLLVVTSAYAIVIMIASIIGVRLNRKE